MPIATRIANGIIANVPPLLGVSMIVDKNQMGKKVLFLERAAKIPNNPNTARRVEKGSSVMSNLNNGTQNHQDCIPVREADNNGEIPWFCRMFNHHGAVKTNTPRAIAPDLIKFLVFRPK